MKLKNILIALGITALFIGGISSSNENERVIDKQTFNRQANNDNNDIYHFYINNIEVGEMEFDGSDAYEFTYNVSQDDVISIFDNNDEEMNITASSAHSSNLRSDLTIKVDADDCYFIFFVNELVLEAQNGYEGTSSDDLIDFCDVLLDYPINNCTFDNESTWDDVLSAWEYVKDNQSALEEFNNADIRYGNDIDYTNLVEEAKTRYSYLISISDSYALQGVNTSNPSLLLNNKSTQSDIIIITTLSITLLLSFISLGLKIKKKEI